MRAAAARDQAGDVEHEVDGPLVPSIVDDVPRVDEHVTGVVDHGVHVGSSPRLEGQRADFTTLKLGPGWLCHPKEPPGATRFSVTMTSESPFVEGRASSRRS